MAVCQVAQPKEWKNISFSGKYNQEVSTGLFFETKLAGFNYIRKLNH